ncbi:hypothetical protein ACQKJ1_01760 [Methylorubrum rhodesianum]|uniref:hypothetical protein n=1 Tax=Methylorubrum rhodesianum TaxID=29427 RepID=UPI003D06DCEC
MTEPFEFDLVGLALMGLEAEMASVALHKAEQYAFVHVDTGRLTTEARRAISKARDADRLCTDRLEAFKRLHSPQETSFREDLQTMIESYP